MKPSQKPLVCVVVLDKQNRRDASSAYQRRFFTRVREAAQACKEKVPRTSANAHGLSSKLPEQ